MAEIRWIPNSTSSTSTVNLHRGKACTVCRRRKIKCDGVKPECGTCQKSSGFFGKCEYLDPSSTRIRVFETRLNRGDDLERGSGKQGSLLHDPSQVQLGSSLDLLQFSSPSSSSSDSPLPSSTHFPYRSMNNSPDQFNLTSSAPVSPYPPIINFPYWPTNSPEPAPSTFASPCPSSTSLPNWSESPKHSVSFLNVPTDTDTRGFDSIPHQRFLQKFFLRCRNVGFFLDESRFTCKTHLLSDTEATGALLDTMYLWSSCWSSSTRSSASASTSDYEATLLNRALDRATRVRTCVSPENPNVTLQYIQAEVLLAEYFFHQARIDEGRAHVASAMSSALSAGLHQIRSADPCQISSGKLSSIDQADASGFEREQIRGFWTVFMLNNLWTTRDGSPCNTFGVPGSRIDTPWSISFRESKRKRRLHSSHTVIRFLANLPDQGNPETSVYTYLAKASILYEEACRLSNQPTPTTESVQDLTHFFSSFSTLELVLNQFIQELPPLHSLLFTDDTIPTQLLTHCTVYAAIIELHSSFLQESSHRTIASAAISIGQLLNAVNVSQFQCFDPALSILLSRACETLIMEIILLRSEGTLTNFFEESMSETNLLLNLNSIITEMKILSKHCPLMESKVAQVQEQYPLLS